MSVYNKDVPSMPVYRNPAEKATDDRDKNSPPEGAGLPALPDLDVLKGEIVSCPGCLDPGCVYCNPPCDWCMKRGCVYCDHEIERVCNAEDEWLVPMPPVATPPPPVAAAPPPTAEPGAEAPPPPPSPPAVAAVNGHPGPPAGPPSIDEGDSPHKAPARNGSWGNDKPVRTRLSEYLDEKVYPALFDRLPTAFPAFGFGAHGEKLEATLWPDGLPIKVMDPRPDRIQCDRLRPWGFHVHGHRSMQWLTFLNNGTPPRGKDFVDGVRTLCTLADVPFPERELTDEEVRKTRDWEARREIIDVVARCCREAIWDRRGDAARAYMHSRGISDEIIASFGIGFYPDPADVRKFLKTNGYDPRDAARYSVLTGRMTGYVVIPWPEPSGATMTFYGRWVGPPPLSKDHPGWAKGRRQGKTIPKTNTLWADNSKSCPLFFDRAIRARTTDRIVALEGLFDAVMLQHHGVTNAVAYVGGVFTKAQVETLKRHRVRQVVVCPDPDEGGDCGGVFCVRALRAAGIESFVIRRLPDGIDPDEFVVKYGIDAWRQHIADPVPGARHEAFYLLGDVTPDRPEIERSKAAKMLVDFARKLTDPLDRDRVVAAAAERTGFAAETLRSMVDATRGETEAPAKPSSDGHAPEDGAVPIDVEGMIKYAGGLKTLADVVNEDAFLKQFALLEVADKGAAAKVEAAIRGALGKKFIAGTFKAAMEGPRKAARDSVPRDMPPRHGVPAASGHLANFYWDEVEEEDGKTRKVQVPLRISQIKDSLASLSPDWPKVVGGRLFTPGAEHTPVYLDKTPAFFAWLHSRAVVEWAFPLGHVSKEEFFEHTKMESESFEAIEAIPHWPPVPGIYYMHPPLPASSGKLDEMIDFFTPATSNDRDLILAYVLTCFWGGPPGKRPVFLTTGPDKDQGQGRGIGKSTLFNAINHDLVGGCLDVSTRDDIGAIKTRLLSGDAPGRMGSIDNLKSLRFSWGDFEGLITNPQISGHEMFHGNRSIPNVLTWTITINGASLSKDMALRTVIIKLGRPVYRADWEPKLRDFVREHRWAIIAEIGEILTKDASEIEAKTRWAEWEQGVLAHVNDPDACAADILARQKAVDEGDVDQDNLAACFVEKISAAGCDPETCHVFIPAPAVAEWVSEALRKHHTTAEANSKLKDTSIPELSCPAKPKKVGKKAMRGWIWRGAQAEGDAKLVVIPLPAPPSLITGAATEVVADDPRGAEDDAGGAEVPF